MRVAIGVDQLFFRVPGGIGAYVRNLVPALAALEGGPSLTLFHARFPGTVPEPWLREHHVVELPHPIRTLYPAWALLGRPTLPGSLGPVDLVHPMNHVAVPPATRDRPLVVTVHDLAFERFPAMFPRAWRLMYAAALRVAVRRASAIVTPSASTAEDVRSRTGVDPATVHVVPLATALPLGDGSSDAVARLRIPVPYVLSVGTLEPRKNHVRLVRAYRRAAANGLPHALVLAGAPGWGNASLTRELALPGPGEVVVTGALPPEDLDALYRGADAFAYVSLYEGFGLPVLEAMARGVPAIVSTTSSLPEVAGDAAIGVDPRSEPEIEDALGSVLTDAALAERLAERGRVRAGRFDWERTARATLEVYGGVLRTA